MTKTKTKTRAKAACPAPPRGGAGLVRARLEELDELVDSRRRDADAFEGARELALAGVMRREAAAFARERGVWRRLLSYLTEVGR